MSQLSSFTASISQEISEKFPPLLMVEFHEYGNYLVAAKYCGLKKIPVKNPGEWQHGHIIPERNIHPEFVIGSDGLSRNRKDAVFFVARQDQVNYLRTEGYTNVKAIGMPILYVQPPKAERIAGSLLIMPMHTLSDTKENFDEEIYAQYIDSIAHQFTTIVCCLHKACFNKGYWVNTFRKRNIEVILGADEQDANSLNRLAFLFSRFEYVTTNAFGSQLAYSALFGAKSSISGPEPQWHKSDYANTTFFGNAPEVLEILNAWQESNFIRSIYPFLYCSPREAAIQQKWSAYQLGLVHKKSKNELAKLFGWDFNTRLIKQFSAYKKRLNNFLAGKIR